jgi:two-component system, NarL family, nitrate/nitrite response regulator NarL
MTAPTRVTVVDDHSLFAESMVIALRAQGYLACCVIPDAASARSAHLEQSVMATHPDIVLLDLDLGAAGSGMRIASTLSGEGISVVVVTGDADPSRRGEALSNGAATVLSKSGPLSETLGAIARVSNGLAAMSREEREQLLSAWRATAEAEGELRARFDQLTTREAEVLGQLMTGKQVSEIARLRFVSESTVRTQVKAVLAKLQVGSQLTAVGIAHQVRWRPPAPEREFPADGVSPHRMSGRPVTAAGPHGRSGAALKAGEAGPQARALGSRARHEGGSSWSTLG